jgi:predicted Zn-ribbon and HTH transcriptional regulator
VEKIDHQITTRHLSKAKKVGKLNNEGMLIRKDEKCEKCGSEFGQWDTVQSTNVECNKCHKKEILYSACKKRGCECGGKLLNVFDKYPGIMH